MKIVKMLSPHTDNFDGYLRSQLNEAEVDQQLAGKYINDMQFPVPVEPEAAGGWKAFFNKHRRKFFFWITAALLAGAVTWYFVQSSSGSKADDAGKPAAGAGTAGNETPAQQQNAVPQNQAGSQPENGGAGQTAQTDDAVAGSDGSAVQKSADNTTATGSRDNITTNAGNIRPGGSAAVSNTTTKPQVDVKAGSLTTATIQKPPAAIDSATKKINAQKLTVKKDTVDIIW
jgi:hypothetical protein